MNTNELLKILKYDLRMLVKMKQFQQMREER